MHGDVDEIALHSFGLAEAMHEPSVVQHQRGQGGELAQTGIVISRVGLTSTVSRHHQDAEEVAGEAQRRHQRMAVGRGVRLEEDVNVTACGLDGDLTPRVDGLADGIGERPPAARRGHAGGRLHHALAALDAHDRGQVGAGRCAGMFDDPAQQRRQVLEGGNVRGCLGGRLQLPRRRRRLLVQLGVAQRQARQRAERRQARNIRVDERVVVVPGEHEHPDQLASLENGNGRSVLHPVQRLAEFGHGRSGSHRATQDRLPRRQQLVDQRLSFQRVRRVVATNPGDLAAGSDGGLDDQPVPVEARQRGPVGAGHRQAPLEDAPHHRARIEGSGELEGEGEQVVTGRGECPVRHLVHRLSTSLGG